MSTESALPTKIDKYEVLGVIGRGGMGVVYKARDPHIDRIVAIKTIRSESDEDNDQIGRLRMEARSAGKLHHPNIVTIFDFGEQGNVSYIVMEFIEGVNLSRVMQKRRPIPLGSKIDVLMQVTRGLAYAHECGVIHRDMKPSNICVTARGIAKILDFGLARYDDTKMTKTGYLSGTIAYMSPERFSGETGPADDIFSLGAVAYEFLTLQRAFPGETTPEVISKILGGTEPALVSQLTGYPAALDDIIKRAMMRDPTDRYRKAADFEVALLEFLRSSDYTAFAQKESTLHDLTKPVDWSDESSKSNISPYSSGKSMAGVAVADAPTIQTSADEVTRNPTEVMKPADPTILTTKPGDLFEPPTRRDFPTAQSAAVTSTTLQVAPKRNRGLLAGIAAIGLIALIGGAMLMRDRSPEPIIKPVTQPPKPVPTATADTARHESEVQLATASSLANVVAERRLTPVERRRLDDANRQLDVARAKIKEEDYAAGAELIGQATRTLRDLLSSSIVATTTSATTTAATTTRPRPTTAPPPVVTATIATGAPPPITETRAPEPPVVQPPRPPVTPAGPTPAELEREVNNFVRAVANAYQEKDVNFFRQNSLQFNEQTAGAIRNSPSMRVEIAVRDIQFSDDRNARVSVRRTDTFAESGMPPGVQNLVYHLRRIDDDWKIVSMARQ